MHVDYFEECQADPKNTVCSCGPCYQISRQMSPSPPLLPLHHVTLPRPSCVTMEQVKTFVRLSILFYNTKILTLTRLDYYEDYEKGRQMSNCLS